MRIGKKAMKELQVPTISEEIKDSLGLLVAQRETFALQLKEHWAGEKIWSDNVKRAHNMVRIANSETMETVKMLLKQAEEYHESFVKKINETRLESDKVKDLISNLKATQRAVSSYSIENSSKDQIRIFHEVMESNNALESLHRGDLDGTVDMLPTAQTSSTDERKAKELIHSAKALLELQQV